MADDEFGQIVKLEIIGQAIDGAQPVPEISSKGSVAALSTLPQGRAGISGRGCGSEQQWAGLPNGCPVTPLGKGQGVSYYLDELRQLITLKARDHGRLNLQDLFGTQTHLLSEFWPRYGKPDADGKFEITGCKFEDAGNDLMKAAARAGIWNPTEKIRGVGAWKSQDGKLINHLGDCVVIEGKEYEPGLIGREVYPAAEPLPHPSKEPAKGGEHGPGMELLRLIKSWNWRRTEIDPMLLLGWIGAAMLGGALTWRPLAWITGGQGTGKSTLHAVLKDIFGGGLVSVTDPTGAGLWQKLGYATLPVAIDELESEVDNRKVDGVIKLARQASSGGIVLRGGQDHKGVEFVTRSCFLFSSINIPSMEVQDLSRLAFLDLEPLKEGSILRLDSDRLAEIGSALRRRLSDGWRRLDETIGIYSAALTEQGHNARGCDQFGTLLACADLILNDEETPGEIAREFAARLKASDIAERVGQISDELGMINHLMTIVVEPYRGGRRQTIGELIDHASDGDPTVDPEESNKALGTYGLKIEEFEGREYLALANQHAGLSGLFANTKWSARPGRSGGWVQSARRIKGYVVPKKTIWIGGATGRCTFIPLEGIFPTKVLQAISRTDGKGEE